jgi:hypothetical protein
MIRRVTEYVIVCDAERFRLECCGAYGGHAFGSFTQDECAESAAREGWVKITARCWLCPPCAKREEQKREATDALT